MKFLGYSLSLVIASAFMTTSIFAAENNLIAVKAVVTVDGSQSYQEVMVKNAGVISFSSSLNNSLVSNFVKNEFEVSVLPDSNIEISSCNEAVIVIKVGKGNILPSSDGRETYLIPQVVSFSCINK